MIIFAMIATDIKAFAEPSSDVPPQATQGQIQMMSGPSLPISYWIPVFLIIFGCLIIWVQYKYLLTVKPNPDVSLPSFSLTLIITGTLVLVSTGMNEKILGTAVGLFGTIAGYVLGRATHSGQKTETESNTEIKSQKTEVVTKEAAPLNAEQIKKE